jgi:hypothetical protein
MLMLIYIGDGSALPDVPARDLTDEEAAKFGLDTLLASKLYKRQKAQTAAEKPSARLQKDEVKE